MPDHDRQGFLEPELSVAMRHARVGIVGLSGGGMHYVQQLAHYGFQRYVIYDPKSIEEKHLHRVVGATIEDVKLKRPKTFVAERLIRGLRPDAQIEAHQVAWQRNLNPLKTCDLIFSAVDTFRVREQLERFARRFTIPLIDIGMGVRCVEGHPPRIAGQVVLSMPGRPCMWCMGFLTSDLLDEEGAEYGDAGGAPQVISTNGELASAAVWMGIDLLTGKLGPEPPAAYLSVDGNTVTRSVHPRWEYVKDAECPHFKPDDVGDPTGCLL